MFSYLSIVGLRSRPRSGPSPIKVNSLVWSGLNTNFSNFLIQQSHFHLFITHLITDHSPHERLFILQNSRHVHTTANPLLIRSDADSDSVKKFESLIFLAASLRQLLQLSSSNLLCLC